MSYVRTHLYLWRRWRHQHSLRESRRVNADTMLSKKNTQCTDQMLHVLTRLYLWRISQHQQSRHVHADVMLSTKNCTNHSEWGSWASNEIYLKPYCNILQHTATHCNILQHTATHCNSTWDLPHISRANLSFWGRSNVLLQCVAVCCSVSQCVAVCHSVLQCVTVCCSVLQCVAVCCSVLQCVAVRFEVDPMCSLSFLIHSGLCVVYFVLEHVYICTSRRTFASQLLVKEHSTHTKNADIILENKNIIATSICNTAWLT